MNITADQIIKLKQQDAETQKWVFQSLFNSMLRVCQRYLIRIDEAEDCVMKGFMKAFQQLQFFTYEHNKSFFNWLKQIMVNEALMALRKQHNLSLVAIEYANDITIDDKLLKDIEAEYLYTAITKLPVGYRTVLNLYIIEGYSHQEIAKLLSITESTSKSQLAKAKHKLRILLTQNELKYGNG